MSLSDLASIGSFVSDVAVVVSLIYLSVQVRHADRNQQAAIRQGRSTRTVDLFMLATDPSAADAIAKAPKIFPVHSSNNSDHTARHTSAMQRTRFTNIRIACSMMLLSRLLSAP